MSAEERIDRAFDKFEKKLESMGKSITEKIDSVDDNLRKKEIADSGIHAEQDSDICALKSRVAAVHTKITNHEENHWKFIVMSVALVGAIIGAAKFLG